MTVVRQTNVPRYADFRKYRPFLRTDFLYRCAYCQHHERRFSQLASMSIDHYRPKSVFPRFVADYANLYYCCGECNTRKGNHWPSQDELNARVGFLDVCQHEWAEHLAVTEDVFQGKTPIGKYTVEHVQLSREMLTERNRQWRKKEADARDELARIDGMRQRFGPDIDPETVHDLLIWQHNAQARLNEAISPEPFED